MRTESHISVALADVNGSELTRHVACRYERGHAFFLAGGVGRPRLWRYALDAAKQGFESVMAERAGDRLDRAFQAARAGLVNACDALIERELPDVHAVAGVIDGGSLRVMAVGGSRVYLHRGGQPQRLTSRDDAPQGLLGGRPSRSETPLEPNDLLLFGSVSSFSVRSVARIASVLDTDPKTAPSVIASLLTEPAREAGLGAAAIVVRVA